MTRPKNYLNRNVEEVRLGNSTINIEVSTLENILGFGFGLVAAAVTSPIWLTYGLYSAGKYGYNKFKENSVKKE
jgi:hypothetical protein